MDYSTPSGDDGQYGHDNLKMKNNPEYVVIISADTEWQVLLKYFKGVRSQQSPYGAWFTFDYSDSAKLCSPVLFIHGGWGKVAAAGSSQYAIDQWHPKLIINLGTCGGFEGKIQSGTIILVEKTIIYDIYEQMGDPVTHLEYYTTSIDLSWLKEPLPLEVTRTLLVSGDRDLFCNEVKILNEKFRAIAGDWESGAIAWVASRNLVDCLILRGVTDLVGENSGEAYDGNISRFYENTEEIMQRLLNSLPRWLELFEATH